MKTLSELQKHAKLNANNTSGNWVFANVGKRRIGCKYSLSRKKFVYTVDKAGQYNPYKTWFNPSEEVVLSIFKGEAQ